MKRLTTVLSLLVLATVAFATGSQESGAVSRPETGPLEPYDPPLTITTWRGDPGREHPEGMSLTDNIWTRAIEDRLGIVFEYVWIAPQGETDTKINTSIAAGDLPDLMTGLNLEQYHSLAKVGILAPMNDLLEKYDIGEVRESLDFGTGVVRQMLAVDGEIYGWGVGPDMTGIQVFAARSDWLEAVGRSVPQSLDEIIDVAYAFTNEDPDGNGRNDTYGIAATESFFGGGFPLEALFALHNSYPELWIEEDGRLVYGALQPETKEALALLRQLHADGVLSPEWPVLGTWSEGPDEVAQGKVGAAFMNEWFVGWSPIRRTVMRNPDIIWEHAYPKNVDGEYYRVPVEAEIDNINAMHSRFSNPEALIKLWNLNYQLRVNPDTVELDFRTIMTDEDVPIDTFPYWNNFFSDPLVNRDLDYHRQVLAVVEGRADLDEIHPVAREAWEMIQLYHEDPTALDGEAYGRYREFGPDSIFALVDVMVEGDHYQVDAFRGSPTPTQRLLAGDLKSSRDEIFVQIIVGERDLDAGWDEWLAYWEANGGDDWAGEVNEWYRENR